MEQFFVGGQTAYSQPGVVGIFVQDDMGNAVSLDGDTLTSFLDFMLDRVIIKSEVPYHA